MTKDLYIAVAVLPEMETETGVGWDRKSCALDLKRRLMSERNLDVPLDDIGDAMYSMSAAEDYRIKTGIWIEEHCREIEV